MSEPILVGAVAYHAKAVPIWEGMRDYFRAGAFAVSVGAGLFSSADVQSGGYERIAERARALIKSYRELSTDQHG